MPVCCCLAILHRAGAPPAGATWQSLQHLLCALAMGAGIRGYFPPVCRASLLLSAHSGVAAMCWGCAHTQHCGVSPNKAAQSGTHTAQRLQVPHATYTTHHPPPGSMLLCTLCPHSSRMQVKPGLPQMTLKTGSGPQHFAEVKVTPVPFNTDCTTAPETQVSYKDVTSPLLMLNLEHAWTICWQQDSRRCLQHSQCVPRHISLVLAQCFALWHSVQRQCVLQEA